MRTPRASSSGRSADSLKPTWILTAALALFAAAGCESARGAVCSESQAATLGSEAMANYGLQIESTLECVAECMGVPPNEALAQHERLVAVSSGTARHESEATRVSSAPSARTHDSSQPPDVTAGVGSGAGGEVSPAEGGESTLAPGPRDGFAPQASADERGLDEAGWFHAPAEQTVVPPHVLRLLEDQELAEAVLSSGRVVSAESLDPEHIVLRAQMELAPEHADALGVDAITVCVKPDAAGSFYGDEYRRELVFYKLANFLGVDGLVPIVERDFALADIAPTLESVIPGELYEDLEHADTFSDHGVIHGTAQIWVEGFRRVVGDISTDETEQLFELVEGVNEAVQREYPDPMWQSLSDMFVLDFLVYNSDRNGELGTVRLPDGGQRLVMLDNGDALLFRDPDRWSRDCRELFENLRGFNPNVYERLAELDRDTIDELLVDASGEELSSSTHLGRLASRVAEAREYIDELADDHGGLENVLFSVPSPPMTAPSMWSGVRASAPPVASVDEPVAVDPEIPWPEVTQEHDEVIEAMTGTPGFELDSARLWDHGNPPRIEIDLGLGGAELDEVFDHLDSVWPDSPRDCPWEELGPGEGEGLYVHGTVTFRFDGDGQSVSYEDVGVRYRGHGADSDIDRLSIELRFNAFDADQRAFTTVEALELFGRDEAYRRIPRRTVQCVGHNLARAFGAPSPRCNYVIATVEGNRLPIMQNLEMPDNSGFIAAHIGDDFSAAGGSYFRCDGDCIGRCHVEYYGESSREYRRYMPIGSTTSDDLHPHLVPMLACADLSGDDEARACFEEYLDVDRALRTLIVEGAMASDDGFGTDGDNACLYDDPEAGFLFILHDLDEARWESMAMIDVDRRFMTRLLDVYRDRWCELVAELLDGPLSNEGFAAILSELFSQRVRDYMSDDNVYPEWLSDIDRWTDIAEERADEIRRGLPDLCPTDTAAARRAPLVEQVVPMPEPFEPHTTELLDLDGDGDLDLVTHDGEFAVATLLNESGTFAVGQLIEVEHAREIVSLAVADFDGDGDPDVAVVCERRDRMLLLYNDAGTLVQAEDYIETGDFPMSLIAMDFDGDGLVDLISADMGEDEISIVQNAGGGAFARREGLKVPEEPIDVAAGDMNGDGFVDIAVASYDAEVISILFGRGDGGWDDPSSFEVPAEPLSLTLADTDDDGDLDVIVAVQEGDGLIILANDGRGALDQGREIALRQEPVRARGVDVNGDGTLDLISANEHDGSISVVLGEGAGRFSTSMTVHVGDDPRFVLAADIDGDAVVELISANHTSYDFSVLRYRPREALRRGAADFVGGVWRP